MVPRAGATATQGKLRNTQMYFGGLPLNTDQASMIVDQRATPQRLAFIRHRQESRPKKFSTEAFLDLYAKSQNQTLTTFEQAR